MFNKITFNSADTSTWPQFILNGVYISKLDKPNLTTDGKYGAGLTWVGINGRDISVYDFYGQVPRYVDDNGGNKQAQFVTAEDEDKFWAEGQMSSFTFVDVKGVTTTFTLNWGEPLADGETLPAEENNDEEESKEEPKPIEGGGDNPAELEDGEKPKEEFPNQEIEIRIKEINSILQGFGYNYDKEAKTMVHDGKSIEPLTVPNSLIEGSVEVPTINLISEFNKLISVLDSKEEPKDSNGESKEEPKEEFEAPTSVIDVANFLQNFNTQIIEYNQALNEIESLLVKTKEGLKKTQLLDTEFTNRKSHVETKLDTINTKQAEKIAQIEAELDGEVAKAEELKVEITVKSQTVSTRLEDMGSSAQRSKMFDSLPNSLKSRSTNLRESLEDVKELLKRDVKEELIDDLDYAKEVKEIEFKNLEGSPIKKVTDDKGAAFASPGDGLNDSSTWTEDKDGGPTEVKKP